MYLATPTLHPTMAAFGNLGPTELIIIAFVLLLLFGGRKLPEMARGTGRALRIFKAETKGLMDDDDDTPTSTPQRTSLPPATSTAPDAVTPAPPSSTGASGTGATAAPESGTPRPAGDELPPTHTEM